MNPSNAAPGPLDQCSRCQGFVPVNARSCPHCRSSSSWWIAPITAIGAGFAAVTLSACYGPGCATKLPDGGLNYPGSRCVSFDCTQALADGGDPQQDREWRNHCDPYDCNATLTDGGDRMNDPTWKQLCDVEPMDAGTALDAGTDSGS